MREYSSFDRKRDPVFGILKRAAARVGRVLGMGSEQRSSQGYHPSDSRLGDLFGKRGNTAAGVAVDEASAVKIAAVYACVSVVSRTLASLPFNLYRQLSPRGREIDSGSDLHHLLHKEPNPEMSSFNFRQAMGWHLVLRHVAYAEIQRNGAGDVVALWPLPPKYVTPRRDRDGNLYYGVSVPGVSAVQALPAYRVLHLKGNTEDGIAAMRPVEVNSESLGLASAVHENAARYFGNGSRPGGLLLHPSTLSKEAKKRLKESWEEAQGGLKNAHRVAVLEDGLKWEAMNLSPEESQLVQSRVNSIEEVARIFNVPLHMIGHLANASFATVEQQNIGYAVHTVLPWCVCIEQDYDRQVLAVKQRRTHFVKHVLDGLLRGDTAARYSAYAIGRNWGWLSIDDVREKEDMNPLPDGRGGDYVQPMNMQAIPAGGLAKLMLETMRPKEPLALPEAKAAEAQNGDQPAEAKPAEAAPDGAVADETTAPA